MRYVIEDNIGQVFPIINLVDANDDKTDDIHKAVSMVVKTPEGAVVPVVAEECPFMVYVVH